VTIAELLVKKGGSRWSA